MEREAGREGGKERGKEGGGGREGELALLAVMNVHKGVHVYFCVCIYVYYPSVKEWGESVCVCV